MSKLDSGRYIKRVANYNIHDYYLDGELGPSEEYRDLFSILTTAGPEDTINLYINGPGGYVSTCMQIANLIRTTEADVVAHLVGHAYSAHSIIFLACNAWVVHPFSDIMIHSYSGGAWGKGQEIIQQATAGMEVFKKLSTEIYYPFLDEQEVDDLFRNQDFWLTDTADILERLERLTEYRRLEMQSAQKAHKEAHIRSLMEEE